MRIEVCKMEARQLKHPAAYTGEVAALRADDMYQRQVSLLVSDVQSIFKSRSRKKKPKQIKWILDIYDMKNNLHAIGNLFLDTEAQFIKARRLLRGTDISGGVRVDEVRVREVREPRLDRRNGNSGREARH